MSVDTMAITAGAILGVTIVAALIILITPPKQRDPQYGMAVGCMMMVVLALLVPAGLLVFGVMGGHPTLVKVIFWVVVIAAGYVATMLIASFTIKRLKQRRWDREAQQTQAPAESRSATSETAPPPDPPR